ncbi:MAG: DUF58 domain-containing protein [Verrucomicrobia bacterium]|nr:DUF58 domain-containing protein [Verrucomicrobiota bacterium]
MLLLRKIIYRVYRLVTAVRYRVRRRFSRAGLAVLAGLFLTGAIGLDMEQTVAAQAFTLLVGLLVLAFAASLRFRIRFSAARSLPRYGTVGHPLAYRVVLRNETPSTQAGLILLEDLADPRPTFEEFVAAQTAEEKQARSFRVSRRASRLRFTRATVKEVPLPLLPPGQESEVQVELHPLKRGVLRFTGLTLARPDPLGLVKAYARLPLPQSVLILPKRYPLPPIALPGAARYQHGGVALASSVGESEEFVAVRGYRRGDPLRHIHWRSWAKTGRPIVKEFEDEFFVRHALILDTFITHPNSEVFEEAVSVAASFACTVQTQESLLDLLFVGPQAYCFTAGRGVGHTEQMLEVLASVQVCRERNFDALEHLVLEHVEAVSGCICVLLAWDERRQKFVEQLRALGVPALVLVIAEAGGARMRDAGPLRDDPASFHVLEVGAIAEGLAKL